MVTTASTFVKVLLEKNAFPKLAANLARRLRKVADARICGKITKRRDVISKILI